jgi:hypothetical protein
MNSTYKVSVSIEGVAGILQHAFGQAQLNTLRTPAKKRTGKQDYSLEWMDTMYLNHEGLVCQPASHIEGAMTKAAASFKMSGRKTWKDAVRGYCFVEPDMIPHRYNGGFVEAPDETLIENPTDNLSVSIMRVVVQRAAVARSRLLIAPGWKLDFKINVVDDQLPPDVLVQILEEAGRAVGIGDYRPRYGRFQVVKFEVEG